MNVKDQLIELVRVLSEEDAAETLDYAERLRSQDDEELTPDELARAELGREQIERGQYVTLAELRARRAR